MAPHPQAGTRRIDPASGVGYAVRAARRGRVHDGPPGARRQSVIESDGGRLPRVTVHYAQTLDGRIATCTGSSQWISGEASLRLAHELRACHAAILVGVGTVLADNPRLTVRLAPGTSPLRIVADSTLRLPLGAHVLTDRAAPTLVVTTPAAPVARREAIRRLGAEVLVLPGNAEGRVDLAALVAHLGRRGVGSLLIEGGRGIITSALRGALVERLVVCIAPKLIGAGIEAVGDLHIRRLSEAVTFTQTSVRTLGHDVIFDGRIAPPGPRAIGRVAGDQAAEQAPADQAAARSDGRHAG